MKKQATKHRRPDGKKGHVPFTETQLKKAKWVKAIFGGRERMWVRVLEVGEGRITGRLDNEPVHVDMKLGQQVTLSYADVIDLMTS